VIDRHPDATDAPIVPGQVIGERYLAGEMLGGGGMGVVFAGTHVLLGTPVAIKLIHSELKDDEEAVQRFVQEARTAASLKGEHIARVFDVGLLPSGEPYLVMEHLEGVALDGYLHEHGPLPQAEAVDIVLQACEGLAEAHAAKLVHRDIKPANLFLSRRVDGQFSLKILDFGIAKQRIDGDTPALTNPGKSLGSPWYMSPEQMLTPASVDERADVWSLGVLLFELLAAKRPFDGESVPQVCASVLTASPPLLRELRDDVAPELERIVLRCLEKEPTERISSVEELAQALAPFASAPTRSAGIALEDAEATTGSRQGGAPHRPASYGSLVPLHADSDASTYSPPLRRRAWPLTLALLVLSLVLAGGWLHYRGPTSLSRAISATQLALPWEPRLLPDGPISELPPPHDLPVWQPFRSARAVPEVEAGSAEPAEESEPLTPEEVRERAANYEAWLRAQGLTRLNALEPQD
jgi:eukaryotic-like serine/threonine-protein kinase